MATDSKQDTPSNPEVRHETRDVHAGPILWFLLGLVVVGLVIHGLVAWLLTGLADEHQRAQPPTSPVAQERPRFPANLKAIPEPRLQESEFDDARQLRDAEERILTTYGWVKPDAKTIRIPIDRAMELLADPDSAVDNGIPIQKGQEP